ncbi:four-helix bundle copper-binding protein [Actinoallomurus sp. NBC_01490]|uniref:four-helix bundle copper-binding protein n=1 Tax=Actinoallomurus sp. NBC_01490 TaxID=2903557 RepID=UPI002E309493|nr:four-helix bundle copper-binding protein [Actinoallomurus sp. NBC_01490]
MFPTRELIDSLETHIPLDSETLAFVVDALSDCEEAVTACAAGMLGDDDIDRLRRSILHDLDCGDVVVATRRLLTRATADDYGLIPAQLEVCLIACERSNETCSRTADVHEHCRLCATATGRAADACRRALDALRGR